MLPPAEASQAINEAFAKPTSHGYVPSCGNYYFLFKSFD
jgi:hypothetical protein